MVVCDQARLSIRLSHAGIPWTPLNIILKFFSPSGIPTILVFHTKRNGNIPTGTL